MSQTENACSMENTPSHKHPKRTIMCANSKAHMEVRYGLHKKDV